MQHAKPRSALARGARQVVVIALSVVVAALTSATARAQPCLQPSVDGCPLEPGSPAEAAVNRPDDAHFWWLSVPAGTSSVQIILSDLPADYRLYIYGPEGSLSALSAETGLVDRVVELPDAAPGRYGIFVDSPRGESSPAPYHLSATLVGGPAEGPAAAPPAAGPPPASGAILFQDTFDGASAGALRTASTAQYALGYVGGEYQIRILDPEHRFIEGAYIPGSFADAAIEVDVRAAGGPGFQTVVLDCREQSGDDRRQYRFVVDPEARSFSLVRRDGADATVELAPLQASAAIRRGDQVNRLLLTCAGTTIAASINGVEVAAVDDATYAVGRMWFGTGRSGAIADLRFDNLLVAQAAPRAPAAPARPGPGTVLIADDFGDPATGWLPRLSTEPASYLQGYVDGEYQIRTLDPQDRFIRGVYVPGAYNDTALTVDVRAVGNLASQAVILDCREQPSGDGQYRLYVDLAERSFRLSRRDSGTSTVDLVALRSSAAIRSGSAVNRLELICAGATITANINGVQIATVQDGAYAGGRMWLGTGRSGAVGELRFDNLVVTQR